MAKKRRRVFVEDTGFKFPEFDERDFLIKEMAETKAAVIVLVYAVVIAVLSLLVMYVADLSTGVMIGTAIGLGAMLLIKFLFDLFKVRTDFYDWKKWAGNVGLYFLTWLAVWILLCNPPVSDFAGPSIENLELKSGASNWTAISNIQAGDIKPGTLKVRAKVTDNMNLDMSSVKIAIERESVKLLDGKLMTGRGNNIFESPEVSVDSGTYTITISARDGKGNTGSYSYQFNVST